MSSSVAFGCTDTTTSAAKSNVGITGKNTRNYFLVTALIISFIDGVGMVFGVPSSACLGGWSPQVQMRRSFPLISVQGRSACRILPGPHRLCLASTKACSRRRVLTGMLCAASCAAGISRSSSCSTIVRGDGQASRLRQICDAARLFDATDRRLVRQGRLSSATVAAVREERS